MFSAGSSLIMLSPTTVVTRPSSLALEITGLASTESSIPIINPEPLMSFTILGFEVTLNAPKVRPWKDELKQIISDLSSAIDFPHLRANFNAASLASAPELLKNTLEALYMPPDSLVFSTNLAASVYGHAVGHAKDACKRVSAWSQMIRVTSGSQCPRELTAIPAKKSIYLLFSVSHK
ncbi:hypothetical protein OGATHE_002288 [Ogataea polymorpha]|uniref:Uncharacterized protein n=1 Tax=Ogataea polymorpha TaxID=460523 RepID=A0A9P8PHX3_9ASCO|nr:hypothetical protein OGATHE_002288 [Ogataea polymorpha]